MKVRTPLTSLLSLVLAAALLFTLLPVSALATELEDTESVEEGLRFSLSCVTVVIE